MGAELTRAQKWLLAGFIALIVAGGAVRLYLSSDAYNRKLAKDSPLVVSSGPEVALLAVDVDGAVARPGVYRLLQGATRAEAVREAGGLAAGADTLKVNLAVKVRDGEKIYIPGAGGDVETAAAADAGPAEVYEAESSATAPVVLKRAKEKRGGARAEKKKPKVVNINSAGADDLTSLPGVGPATAEKIVDLRKTRGPFRTIEEIMLVKGIGQKKFDKMKNYLRVN